jgi:glycosyltransferase involved in cell wall biosynthesis
LAHTSRPLPDAFLVAPYGQVGGGMGRIMEYVARTAAQTHPGLRLAPLESRGPGSAWRSPLAVARAGFALCRARLSGRPAVHLNIAEGSSVARKGLLLLLARALGLPAIAHLHAADIHGFYGRLPPPGRRALAALFRRATHCIVLGRVWQDWLTAELGVPAARITILPNGVPTPPAQEHAEAASPATAPDLLFLGNLLPRKGLDDLLHALGRPALLATPWRLVVAGGGDPAPYRRLAAELGLGGRIAFAGWLTTEAAGEALQRARALILPSHREGLPLVILEALARGIPVVTTPVGAIPDHLVHEETALLVPPGDPDALAAAIARLLADPALARRLSENGRALHRARFSEERFLADLVAIWRTHARLAPAPP